MVEAVQNSTDTIKEVSRAPSKHADPLGVAIFYFIGRKVYVIVRTINALYVRIRDVFSKTHLHFDFEPSSYSSCSFDAPSASSRFPLREAPRWREYDLKARRGKIKQLTIRNAQHVPLHRISEKMLKSALADKKDKEVGKEIGPIQTVKFGAGIPNGANCCFIASVLQALRVSPSFRNRLKDPELRDSPVVSELRKIYAIIEGSRGHPKRELTGEEITHFRQVCIESGCQLDSRGSQEDSSNFCQFLMYQMGLKVFPIRAFNEHNLGIPANTLEPDEPLTDNLVVLQVANAHEAVSELKELVRDRAEVVEVEPKLVRKDLLEKQKLTPEIEEKLKTLKDVELVNVKQTIQLFPDHIPKVLPIYLERAGYDRTTGQNFINNRKIAPSSYIDFPLVKQPGLCARYEFISAVTRQVPITDEMQKSVNKDSGHYVGWTKYQHKDKALFAEYNSGKSLLHTDTADKAFEDIKQNSRLFLYEFVGIVKA